MQYWNLFWDWNSVESVRFVHNLLEGCALLFFALLVIFEVFSHLSEDADHDRAKTLDRIGLWCFGIAVIAEIFAYPYSRRNDTLSSQQDAAQRSQIAVLDNSTQALRTAAEIARNEAEGFKSKIASSQVRIRIAEATVASANAAVRDAVAKVATADARIAEAQLAAAGAKKEAAMFNETAERERLARVKLEERLNHRVLDRAQRQRMIDALKPFTGTPYELGVNPDPEAISLLMSIDEILRSSGWISKKSANTKFRTIFPLASGSEAEIEYVSGVYVRLSRSMMVTNQAALEALIHSLKAEKIGCMGGFLEDENPSPNSMHVTIGTKE